MLISLTLSLTLLLWCCPLQEQPIEYGSLDEALRKACSKMGLKDVPGFIHKCIQLYETTVVRHGLMLVGPTGSGKTKVSVETGFSPLSGMGTVNNLVQGTHSTGKTGKTGKMAKKNPCQRKHRNLEILPKHRENMEFGLLKL